MAVLRKQTTRVVPDGKAKHVRETQRLLRCLAADCAFNRLSDLHRQALERWLTELIADRQAAALGRPAV